MKTANTNMFNPDFFEHVKCNLCGASDKDADILFDADTKKIPKTKEEFIKIYSSSSSHVFYEQLLRCKNCGLIYLSPRPKQDLIVKGYCVAKDQTYVTQEQGRELTFKNCLKTVKRFCKKGNLLDIGAASGIFVKLAKEAGYDAYGIEPAIWMCEFARKKYNVTILPGMLEDARLKDASFDIVTMWDVLEHVPDPLNTLKEVKRILKRNGILVINYPRIDDPLARIFGRRWWFLLSVHLFYFTPRTLSIYLENLGFKKMAHKMHFQRLAYGYLVERLNNYSPILAGIAKAPYIIPGLRKILLPYFASQYLMIARKKE